MIRIRNYTEKDRESVMKIWLHSNIAGHYFIPQEYWMEHFDEVRDEYLPKSKIFVAEEDGEILGFAAVQGEDYLGALFVSEEYWRKGIGKRLLNRCKKRYERLILNVYAENEGAVVFYEKMGFKKSGRGMSEGFLEYSMEWAEKRGFKEK